MSDVFLVKSRWRGHRLSVVESVWNVIQNGVQLGYLVRTPGRGGDGEWVAYPSWDTRISQRVESQKQGIDILSEAWTAYLSVSSSGSANVRHLERCWKLS